MLSLLQKIGIMLYVYCTDFTINMANILGLSYYEINAFIFCILWPVITLSLILIFVFLKLRYKHLRSK